MRMVLSERGPQEAHEDTPSEGIVNEAEKKESLRSCSDCRHCF